MSDDTSVLFEAGRIGPVELRNRFVRASTSEGMTDTRGHITDDLVAMYEGLARGGVGLILSGHMFVDRRGQYDYDQAALDDDAVIPPLQTLTSAAHRHGGKVFAQLAHAGSQSIVAGNRPLAPSPVPNAMTGRDVPGATEDDIGETVDAFGAAARRACEAGFDGVHIHGANGYLISEFCSPLTNRRTDAWGGSPDARHRFPVAVARAARAAVPATHAVTFKLGFEDMVPDGGLTLDESVPRAAALVEAGVDGIEVSCNVMASYLDNIVPYVAVDRGRAARDWLLHRVVSGAEPPAEGYYRQWSRALRDRVETSVMLVGGLRTTETMSDVVRSGDADFVALSRPFIREPDLVRQIEGGRRGLVSCTSCNICLMHAGHHPLQCWRTPRRRLLHHAWYRVRGGFRGGAGSKPEVTSAADPGR